MAAQDFAQTTGAAAPASRQALVWATGGYALMILGAIGAFLLIRSYGIAAAEDESGKGSSFHR